MTRSCWWVVAALTADPAGMRFTPALFRRSSSFARSSIHRVTSVSAGPPLGGLYLKPPSSGGLCDGVMTMPSASPARRPMLWQRIACETAGVGVGVAPDEQRAVDPLPPAMAADRLRDGQDVLLGERSVERRAAVARSAE